MSPCHGDPAGEEDVTGYAKEGMTEGDVAGAVSIVMPMDSIIADAKADLASTVVFFCVLMGSVTLILALGLRTWITAPIVMTYQESNRYHEIKMLQLAGLPENTVVEYIDMPQSG